ncbi:MAG: hypothetical protein ABIC95_03155 [archaeon]
MLIHVDMSGQLNEKKAVGVAWYCAETSQHRGVALSPQFKKKVLSSVKDNEVFPKIYASCIFLLILDYLDDISSVVICNDEPFTLVKNHLSLLLGEITDTPPEILSKTQFQRNSGITRFRSPADNFANHYRKRGLKRRKLFQGKKLHIKQITVSEITALIKKK